MDCAGNKVQMAVAIEIGQAERRIAVSCRDVTQESEVPVAVAGEEPDDIVGVRHLCIRTSIFVDVGQLAVHQYVGAAVLYYGLSRGKRAVAVVEKYLRMF